MKPWWLSQQSSPIVWSQYPITSIPAPVLAYPSYMTGDKALEANVILRGKASLVGDCMKLNGSYLIYTVDKPILKLN